MKINKYFQKDLDIEKIVSVVGDIKIQWGKGWIFFINGAGEINYVKKNHKEISLWSWISK